jgi:hypothetical protein
MGSNQSSHCPAREEESDMIIRAKSFRAWFNANMIAGFRRDDMIDTLDTFKNLMVWFACETVARELHPDL